MLSPVPTENADSFEDFLKAVEPKLKRLLAYHRIPSEDAEDILQQSLLALLYQWERVQVPERWLFGTVRRHCLMYWRATRRKIYSSGDATILEWLSEPVATPQERRGVPPRSVKPLQRVAPPWRPGPPPPFPA